MDVTTFTMEALGHLLQLGPAMILYFLCIPQLIDAPAGYVTTDQFPYNIYCIKPLHEYVTGR